MLPISQVDARKATSELAELLIVSRSGSLTLYTRSLQPIKSLALLHDTAAASASRVVWANMIELDEPLADDNDDDDGHDDGEDTRQVSAVFMENGSKTSGSLYVVSVTQSRKGAWLMSPVAEFTITKLPKKVCYCCRHCCWCCCVYCMVHAPAQLIIVIVMIRARSYRRCTSHDPTFSLSFVRCREDVNQPPYRHMLAHRRRMITGSDNTLRVYTLPALRKMHKNQHLRFTIDSSPTTHELSALSQDAVRLSLSLVISCSLAIS